MVEFIVVALLMWLINVFIESKKARWVALSVLLSIPCWVLLFFAVLFEVVAREPLQEIHLTVTSPESVYWHDEVWPGFDATGRTWMVEQYLDGIHLKALALNGDNGTVYLYRADEETFAEARRLRPARDQEQKEIEAMEEDERRIESSGGDTTAIRDRIRKIERPASAAYANAMKEAHQGIWDQVEVLQSPAQLPPMRYRVHFEPLDHWWQKIGLGHTDRIAIIETASGKEIAWSQRYIQVPLSWFFFKKPPKYLSGPGNQYPYQLDNTVLFAYTGIKDDWKRGRSRLWYAEKFFFQNM
jgi:hypothetical protein